MTWETAVEAIRAAVVEASGLATERVVWTREGSDGTWIEYPRVKLTPVRSQGIGLPTVVHSEAEDKTIIREVYSVHLLTVVVRIESIIEPRGLGAFYGPAGRLAKVIRTPEVSDALAAEGVAIMAFREFTTFQATDENREVSATLAEAVFQVNAPEDTTPQGGVGWFDTVEVTNLS